MPLRPEDIAKKTFTSTRLGRGYDEAEVDDFLDEVQTEIARLRSEITELRAGREEAEAAAAKPGSSRGDKSWSGGAEAKASGTSSGVPVESRATGILALAHRTAEQHVADAKAEADRILGAARGRAEELDRATERRRTENFATLERDRRDLERRIGELREFEREYRSRLRAYLQRQLGDLDSVGETMGATPGESPSAPGKGAPGTVAAAGVPAPMRSSPGESVPSKPSQPSTPSPASRMPPVPPGTPAAPVGTPAGGAGDSPADRPHPGPARPAPSGAPGAERTSGS